MGPFFLLPPESTVEVQLRSNLSNGTTLGQSLGPQTQPYLFLVWLGSSDLSLWDFREHISCTVHITISGVSRKELWKIAARARCLSMEIS